MPVEQEYAREMFDRSGGIDVGKYLVVSSWVTTVLIAVLGVYAGQTIWYYQEPTIDTVSTPQSFFVAVYAGLAVLILTVAQSIGVSVHFAIRKADTRKSGQKLQPSR